MSVGHNSRLVANDLGAAIRRLSVELDGEIDVTGPELTQSLSRLGLIDERRIYLHPVVLGSGGPFFVGPRPPLRLEASERKWARTLPSCRTSALRPTTG